MAIFGWLFCFPGDAGPICLFVFVCRPPTLESGGVVHCYYTTVLFFRGAEEGLRSFPAVTTNAARACVRGGFRTSIAAAVNSC